MGAQTTPAAIVAAFAPRTVTIVVSPTFDFLMDPIMDDADPNSTDQYLVDVATLKHALEAARRTRQGFMVTLTAGQPRTAVILAVLASEAEWREHIARTQLAESYWGEDKGRALGDIRACQTMARRVREVRKALAAD
jgi:hypothetical protein